MGWRKGYNEEAAKYVQTPIDCEIIAAQLALLP